MGVIEKRCFTKRGLWCWKNHVIKYFVTIEIYDFSVSEDEVLSLKDGSKQTQTTRLGLQVRFTNTENGTYFVGSGLGE